jgi:hypothetical protein
MKSMEKILTSAGLPNDINKIVGATVCIEYGLGGHVHLFTGVTGLAVLDNCSAMRIFVASEKVFSGAEIVWIEFNYCSSAKACKNGPYWSMRVINTPMGVPEEELIDVHNFRIVGQ